jgi:hypothetical protein
MKEVNQGSFLYQNLQKNKAHDEEVNFLIFFYTLYLKQKFKNDFFTSVGQNVSPTQVLKHIIYFTATKCVTKDYETHYSLIGSKMCFKTVSGTHYSLIGSKMCIQNCFWNTLFPNRLQNVSPNLFLEHIIP